jgi:hypothetical protein
LDDTPGLQTFNINLPDVLSFNIQQGPLNAGAWQIDNVVFNKGAVVSVPEPTSWAGLLFGLAAIPCLRRRRKTEDSKRRLPLKKEISSLPRMSEKGKTSTPPIFAN